MKKNNFKTGLIVAAAVLALSGCGNRTSEITVTDFPAETKSRLEDDAKLVLGEYKGLSHTIVRAEVTEEDIQAELQKMAEKYPPRLTYRAAKLGDTANIDYEGTKDGIAFPGGTAYAHDLDLGAGIFIDGFEEGVVGMLPGEEKDLNLTFPDDYFNTDLAGQDVVFHVKLNYVTNQEELAIDDGLAQRISYRKDDTLENLRSQISEELAIDAEAVYYLDSAGELLEQAVANSEVTVDPEAAEERIDELVGEYKAQAVVYGMDYKEYLSVFMNTTPEQVKIDAVDSLKEEMVLNEILKVEHLEASDEQKNMVAKINGCRDTEQLIFRYGEEQVEKMYGMYAGVYYLIEHAAE